MPARRANAAIPVALALAACLGTALAAQPAADGGFAESIDVDVVSLEVFVTDRSDRPVAGLGRGDFELRVDGKPVPITNFYASSGAAPAPSGAPAVAAAGAPPAAAPAAAPSADGAGGDQRLNLIVFVDNLNLTSEARNRALRGVTEFFRQGLRRDDRLFLASYDGYAVKLRRPPDGDAEAAVAALRDIASAPAIGTHVYAEEELALKNMGPTEPEVQAAITWLETITQEKQRDGRALLTTLFDFVGSVAGLPGRKVLLYLSGDLRVPAGDSMFRLLADRANAEQVTLYGLGATEGQRAVIQDPTGRNTYLDMRGMTANPDVFSATLEAIAGPTGGLSGLDLDHPAGLLGRIRADLSTYYSLGFAPAHPGDGKRHTVQIRVPGRRGLSVRHAATYTARSRDQRFAGRVLGATVAAAAAVADNPLGVRLAVERDERAPSGRRALTVLVSFPLGGLTLLPGRGGREGRVTLLYSARDSAGRNLPVRRAILPIRVPDTRLAAARQESAGYRLQLELPPGASTLAVGVRDELGGGESTVSAGYTAGALAAAVPAAHPAPPGAR